MTDFSSKNPLAYFCAEYGFDSQLPIYAGGLGVLAGDTLKAAADANFPLVGVGLLYRGNESVQRINEDGEQVEEKFEFDPVAAGLEHVYVEDMPLFVKVHLTTVDVWVRCWKKVFNENVTLYLLDTETDQNPISERGITHALYYGSEEELLKQQMILGIGGVKLLHELGIHPNLYHINEGRPAFLHWQLIRTYMFGHGMSYEEAKELAKKKTVYTNHTLIAAGNQSYSIHSVKTYAQYYADKIGVDIDTLLKDGVEEDSDAFNITRFALNISKKASAVSQIHEQLCKQDWPEYQWEGVTNGVHLPTWQNQNISLAGDSQEGLWKAHLENKEALREYVAGRSGFSYDSNSLILTWARRIAGYKQLEKLFEDIERFRDILRNEQWPVQLLVAGKAHYGDLKGKALIKKVIDYMKQELAGRALFVPNYDLDLAKMLAQGSDVWLNTPEVGREACGTSGMKAISNGVLQLSVADGWMAEVDIKTVGWQLDPEKLSDSIYKLLENQVQPSFYQRNANGIPEEWVAKMQSAVKLSQSFSTSRMFQEYREKLYQ